MSKIWRLRLADQVELDLRDIVAWTADHFGPRQADGYLETVTRAIEALHDGPAIVGVQDRNDIGPGMRTLHVARLGRRGRHFIVFRAADEQTIDILRLLHDSMDLVRHLPLSEDRP
jgi:toxin ParE1/3/4